MLYKSINDIHKIIVLENDTIKSGSKDEIIIFKFGIFMNKYAI